MNRAELRAMATLACWLGPWADAKRAPAVDAFDDTLDELRVRIYGATGKPFLIAPGLHYAGPDDPRMDRFCRILAAAGHLVIAPFIPDFLALAPSERAKTDFTRVLLAMPRWSPRKPVVFSISFGSLLAFAAAAEHPALVERLVIFGGYADLRETLAFGLTGEVPGSRRQATRDPLNQPVVLMNLLHLLEPAVASDADRQLLLASWRRYVERTWGRPEMKAPERFAAVADELAADVPAHLRERFLVGIGVRPGARELALAALERFDARALDPAPYLSRVTGRVELVHGTDDDVIPFEHSHALARGLSRAEVRVHVTGMYGHTGASGFAIGDGARELTTMVRVLRALV